MSNPTEYLEKKPENKSVKNSDEKLSETEINRGISRNSSFSWQHKRISW